MVNRNEFIQCLRQCGQASSIHFRLANQCGPVIFGAAVGNLVTVSKEACKETEAIFYGGPITTVPVWKDEDRAVLLLYRSSLLDTFLEEDAVSCLMRHYGYGRIEVGAVLSVFGSRYRNYREGRSAFPHELGLLLGYPPEDVRGYIKNRGRNYLLSGYWKVYQDTVSAANMFQQYDEARFTAMKLVLSGRSLSLAAK